MSVIIISPMARIYAKRDIFYPGFATEPPAGGELNEVKP